MVDHKTKPNLLYLIYMCKENLTLNNLQCLICQKTCQPSESVFHNRLHIAPGKVHIIFFFWGGRVHANKIGLRQYFSCHLDIFITRNNKDFIDFYRYVNPSRVILCLDVRGRVHCMFVFIFYAVSKDFFGLRSYRIRILIKQIYFILG